jgi:hypothetical protein
MAKSKAKSKIHDSKAKSKIHDDELPEEIEAVDEAGADEVEAGEFDASFEVEDAEGVEEADADKVKEADADDVEVADVDAESVEMADADAVEDVDAVVAESEFGEIDDADAKVKSDDGDDDEEPEDRAPARPKPPRPKLTKTVIALILLNWLAAPAFLVMAWMDYSIRMQYSYRTIVNYVQMIGLPLREEEDFASFSNETQRRVRLSKEQIAAEYGKRAGVNKSVKDFVAVDEPIPFRLRPSDMDKTLMDAVFGGLPDPVKTLEDEIERLKDDKTGLPKLIADAAAEVLKKNQADKDAKQKLVRTALYPIIGEARWKGDGNKDTPLYTWDIDKVNDRLLKATDAELDEMVKDAVERRIYWDILAPLNLFRPGDLGKSQIEKIGDLTISIADIKSFLIDRLNASIADSYDTKVHLGAAFAKGLKRDTAEKRRKIGFILFTLGQVEKPGLNEKLIKKGVERAQTISGLFEFTNATIDFVITVRVLEGRLAKAIRNDRDGETFKKDGALTRNEGFIDLYEQEINRLVALVSNLEAAQKRLVDLNKRKTEVEVTYNQRAKQFEETMTRLLKEREITAKYMKDLRGLQDQLHDALVELSDAAETNLRILDDITAIESDYIRKNSAKGGKK